MMGIPLLENIIIIFKWVRRHLHHYNDVIMSALASQITSLTIVYSAALPSQINSVLGLYPKTRRHRISYISVNFPIGFHASIGNRSAERSHGNFLQTPRQAGIPRANTSKGGPCSCNMDPKQQKSRVDDDLCYWGFLICKLAIIGLWWGYLAIIIMTGVELDYSPYFPRL